MRKKYKWGIIGCGNVTELRSGPAYQKVEGFELQCSHAAQYFKSRRLCN
ncbi:hypothetical protein [Flavobacterium sp. LS1P28]|nr:hypothetical protein [Flavobacterium sp. LS1P28]